MPPGRYGVLRLAGQRVDDFKEKPQGDGAAITGGFFVHSPKLMDYIEGDSSSWEGAPIKEIARDGQLMAFAHNGFWHAIDRLRDKTTMNSLWEDGKAPWKIW